MAIGMVLTYKWYGKVVFMFGVLLLAVSGLALGSLVFDGESASPDDQSNDDGDASLPSDGSQNLRESLGSYATDPVDGERPEPESTVQLATENVLQVDRFGETYEGTATSDSVIVDLPNEVYEGYVSANGSAFYDAGYVDEQNGVFRAGITEINLGSGDDNIVVENGSAVIRTGEGNDTVDAHGLASGIIFAGSGDLVFGSNVQSGSEYGDEIGIVADGAVFQGGTASEHAIGIGEGTELFGNGGNDNLYSYFGDITLDGGEGNDSLFGNANEQRFCECTRASSIDEMTNDSVDHLYGGAGNDTLELSHGDFGTGGIGADEFTIYNSNNTFTSLAVTTVTDFSPEDDALVLYVGGGDAYSSDDISYDLSGRIEVYESDENTHILVDGFSVVKIEDATQLRIGFPYPGNLDSLGADTQSFIDVDTGNVGTFNDFDMFVKVFPRG